ncbi:MAG: transposase [Saprospiraceae bacterium]|nr:transposase [Saprospiraceae bacterium]
MHDLAAQTLPQQSQRLRDLHNHLLRQQAPKRLKRSRYLAVDAFFCKKSFVDTALESGLEVITRLRDDAVLPYALPPKKEGRRRQPKKYGDRFSARKVDAQQLPCVAQKESHRIYAGVAFVVKSLRRVVNIAIVHELNQDGVVKSVKRFICSTDLKFPAQDIWSRYKSRLQVEFLYRDAKRHTGLADAQNRHPKALESPFNLWLTAVSVAKAVHSLSKDKRQRRPFSMVDVKTQDFNERMTDRIFDMLAEFLNLTKNHPEIGKLYDLGKIAA